MYHHKCTFTEFDRKLSFWKEVRQRLWGKRGAGSFLQPFYSACVMVGGEWKLSWVLNWISPSILAYSQHICVCLWTQASGFFKMRISTPTVAFLSNSTVDTVAPIGGCTCSCSPFPAFLNKKVIRWRRMVNGTFFMPTCYNITERLLKNTCFIL